MASGIVDRLIEKGVRIPNPEAVTVGEDVDIERISANGVVLFPGCRITGASTLILDDVRIGTEGCVALDNCRVGAQTALSAGFFAGSVFLGQNRVGPGAHFREGTILEEAASAAHCVGLKQTILFPFVTLGSLINFCDCLMTGGTGPKDHSEVGSSFIHFNFTPNQDKATASLVGDVPRGVMLDQRPIFLGGQGGMVGPCRVAFGTVTASGTILRKDVRHTDRLVFEAPRRSFNAPNTPGLYRNVRRIVHNNLHYIASLKALEAWYTHFRRRFFSEPMAALLWEGLCETLVGDIDERVRRMSEFVEKLPESLKIYRALLKDDASEKVAAEKNELIKRWPSLAEAIRRPADDFEPPQLRERFFKATDTTRGSAGTGYIETIQGLSAEARAAGTAWLQGVADRVKAEAYAALSSFAPEADPETPR
jgi:UDP-N-acetylglucosamine/UDP-N-acetylgalactosamine diphosphorylase